MQTVKDAVKLVWNIAAIGLTFVAYSWFTGEDWVSWAWHQTTLSWLVGLL